MKYFNRIKKFDGRKKSALVAEQILGLIRQGVLKPGDRLPAERTIADELGVSRAPVREALSALQIMNLVEIVIGDGSYVTNANRGQLLNSKTISLLEENESPFEILKARETLETTIIEIAAAEAGPEEIADMRSKLAAMQQAVEERDFETYFKANRNFHLSIARATHNSVLVKIMELLFEVENQPLWREVCQKHFSSYDHIHHFFPQHRLILEAIAAGDVARAKLLARNHFRETVDEVKRYL